MGALVDKNAQDRWRAAEVLQDALRPGDTEHSGPLLALLKDKSDEVTVRCAAAKALAATQDACLLDTIAAILCDKTDEPMVRGQAATVLRQIRNAISIGALTTILKDDDESPQVQSSVVSALCWSGTHADRESTIETLRDMQKMQQPSLSAILGLLLAFSIGPVICLVFLRYATQATLFGAMALAAIIGYLPGIVFAAIYWNHVIDVGTLRAVEAFESRFPPHTRARILALDLLRSGQFMPSLEERLAGAAKDGVLQDSVRKDYKEDRHRSEQLAMRLQETLGRKKGE
jgi:hypothetical protein